jgi:hypothetical protein
MFDSIATDLIVMDCRRRAMAAGYSLHIGLNAVDPAQYGGWDGALGGCEPDARDMQKLAKARGYKPELLLTKKATSQAVLSALAKLATTMVAGDALLLTYSGHGGQYADTNKDEGDGLDETWCLFDRQVLDDELYAMYAQFAAGTRIFVLSDSCHSGTVIKAMPPLAKAAAASGPIMSLPAPASTYAIGRKPAGTRLAPPKAINKGLFDAVQAVIGPKVADKLSADILLMSGCQDNQLSADLGTNGLFTVKLGESLEAAGKNATFRQVHKRLVSLMPSDQTPNLMTLGLNGLKLQKAKAFAI